MIHHGVLYKKDGKVAINYINPITKKETEFDLECTWAEYDAGLEAYAKGDMMQTAFNFLTADEREVLISGMTPEQWEALIPDE